MGTQFRNIRHPWRQLCAILCELVCHLLAFFFSTAHVLRSLRTQSLWDLQRKSCQNVVESDSKCTKLFATLRALVVGSADRQSKVTQQRLKLVAGMQELKHNPKHTLWVTRQIENF